MNRHDLIESAEKFIAGSTDNFVPGDLALSKEVEGMKIFDKPIFGFAMADDELFKELQRSEVIGRHVLIPEDWLPGARTVISFFMPFTERVKRANSRDFSWPADEWLHARIEGQAFLEKVCEHLRSVLIDAGNKTVVPIFDPRFRAYNADPDPDLAFSSNWSERHAAYICGLGTFSLSKGLITEKGVAGRFGSLVTELYLPPDKRPYSGLYDYCTMCGLCEDHCPAEAISLEKGKEHLPCFRFLNNTLKKCRPRYGCGKCQVDVPCESCAPGKP